MPIDVSIPLQVQSPKFMTPGDALSLQNVARQGRMQQIQLQEAEQGQERKNALRQVMQGATDPATGRLTPQGLSQITQLDPEMGLNLGRQQEQLRLQDLAINQKKDELKKHVGTSYVTAYDRYLQQTGGNTQQAQQLAQKDTLAAIEEMERGGTLANIGLDSNSIQRLKTLPPAEQMRAMVVSLGGQIPDRGPSQRQERKRIAGDQEIQEEFDPVSKSWREIGRGPRFSKQVNPAEEAAKRPPSGYRWTSKGELEVIPGGPADKPTERILPTSAAQKLMENQQNLRRAEQALTLIQGGSVGDAKGKKSATGMKGFLPDAILQRIDPSGVDTRAAISDLGSLVIHDRSGAAVTAAEFPRLRPFIPTHTDDPATVEKKLKRFVGVYKDVVGEAVDFYKESGYRVPGETLRSSEPKKEEPKKPASGGWKIERVGG
jgi:hypothetical protein